MAPDSDTTANILVSVLLPVRDAASTLSVALGCISDQIGFEQDLEILVIDDGSRDHSRRVAERAAGEDPRIHVLSSPGLGLVSALNHGLARSRGAYIARMDADDLCAPNRLAVQLRAMQRLRLDLVASQVSLFPAEKVSRSLQAYVTWQNAQLVHRCLTRNLLVESPLVHGTVVIRKAALESVGGWRQFDGPEDLDLWLRGAAAGWRFGKINRVLYSWGDHPGRATRVDSRYRREAFQSTCLDAASNWLGEDRPVLLWGWGNALAVWERGLRSRRHRVNMLAVNPRSIRGGLSPELPSTAEALILGKALSSSKHPVWLLAYGTQKSRKTLRDFLHLGGFHSGRDYCFVS